ncbi:MAG: argininosuccinate lyase [Pseudomonadota bacterium]
MSLKPWDGRFSEKTDASVEAFTASVKIDSRLYPYDIEGSIAHCSMLARQGIITQKEADQIIEGLAKIKGDIDSGEFIFNDSLEDVHMNIEARLASEIGDVAKKIHTARSRNDQVALDMRMFLKDESKKILELLSGIRRELTLLARKHLGVIMPGYTHTQRAQPVLLSHHFMAYNEMFKRDAARFQDGLARIDVLPLGSGALAGTTLPIDMSYTAQRLGFLNISQNSIDAVSDRDFVIEFISAAAISMVHLSRLSEELIYWSSSEFGFVEMPDSFATGSSIMPQKKNPDVCELVRGKSGRVFGNLTSMLVIMKSLPLAYNRDMQEDKEPLFDTVDTLKSCLNMYVQLLPRLIINADKMREAANIGFLNATDLADYLVRKGVGFRDAHRMSGEAVGFCLKQHKELNELTLDELKGFSPLIENDVFDALKLENVVDRRTSIGGTARENVSAMIRAAEKELGILTDS